VYKTLSTSTSGKSRLQDLAVIGEIGQLELVPNSRARDSIE
jgi:hypothetical protein